MLKIILLTNAPMLIFIATLILSETMRRYQIRLLGSAARRSETPANPRQFD